MPCLASTTTTQRVLHVRVEGPGKNHETAPQEVCLEESDTAADLLQQTKRLLNPDPRRLIASGAEQIFKPPGKPLGQFRIKIKIKAMAIGNRRSHFPWLLSCG